MPGRFVPQTVITAIAAQILLLAIAASAPGRTIASPIRGACYTGTFGGSMRTPKNWVVDRATPAEVRHPGRFASDVGADVSIIYIKVKRNRNAINPAESVVSPAFRRRRTSSYLGGSEWELVRSTTWYDNGVPIPPVSPPPIVGGKFTSAYRDRDTVDGTYYLNGFVRGHFTDHGRKIVGVLRWQAHPPYADGGYLALDSGWLRFTARAGDPYLCSRQIEGP